MGREDVASTLLPEESGSAVSGAEGQNKGREKRGLVFTQALRLRQAKSSFPECLISPLTTLKGSPTHLRTKLLFLAF